MTPTDLKAWRKALGWSQAHAAQQIGISRRQFQRYEWGDAEIPMMLGIIVRFSQDKRYRESLEAVMAELNR